ncbi:hypothetical protein TNIN_374971 [Trichonephila inaurata madagascariensis]|uniref:Uncharacterized protein n=1 Tax=Trichonephila inaurata madagascariensis TaxID=2747483 RepID=A0A8X7BPU3_9ARAC|nr:hypothetical protein TNIN_374971 [Trichonephila inaurata madagascariensis]
MEQKFCILSDEEILSTFCNSTDIKIIGHTVKEAFEVTKKKSRVLQSLKELNISLTSACKKLNSKKGKRCLRKIKLSVFLTTLLKEKGELNRTIKKAQSCLSDVLTKIDYLKKLLEVPAIYFMATVTIYDRRHLNSLRKKVLKLGSIVNKIISQVFNFISGLENIEDISPLVDLKNLHETLHSIFLSNL